MKTYRHPGTQKRGTLVQDDAVYNDEMHKRMCANLQDCVQRHGLGEAGERLDVIVVRELDRLKLAEDVCADPSECDPSECDAKNNHWGM
jgi:hypothetical protein